MSDPGAVDPAQFEAVLAERGVAAPLDRSAAQRIVPVRALVAGYARLIGADDEMIAASYAFQSVVAGLAGPVLGGALLLGAAPQFGAADVRWGDGPWGPRVGVGPAAPRLVEVAPAEALDGLVAVVGELADAFRSEVRIARRLLHGNAAAAMLAVVRRAVAADRGATAAGAHLAVHVVDVFGHPPVAVVVALDGWTTFRRQTCCLLRFAGARGVCDECSLLDPVAFVAVQRRVRGDLLGR